MSKILRPDFVLQRVGASSPTARGEIVHLNPFARIRLYPYPQASYLLELLDSGHRADAARHWRDHIDAIRPLLVRSGYRTSDQQQSIIDRYRDAVRAEIGKLRSDNAKSQDPVISGRRA